jgi:adenylate kinase family enzyme
MKPKIIEIIGPPGVGKSTIYQSLCSSWKSHSNWVHPDVLLTSQPAFFTFRKWLGYRLRMMLGKKLTKAIPVDYGMRFAGQQQELAKFCWQRLTDLQLYDDAEISKSFRSAYFLFTTFCMYQAIMERSSAKPCIIQEGFLQKSFFIREDEAPDGLINELLNKYLRLIPLPYAVIYMDTPDVNEIIKRLRGRNKVIASHVDKDNDALRRDIERWQHMHNIILEKLQHAGVLIVRIDGKQPVTKNVSEIKELLQNIDHARGSDPVECSNGSQLQSNEILPAGIVPADTYIPTER